VEQHAGAVVGLEAVPDSTVGKWIEESLVSGPWWVCQTGMSDGQKDGPNRGGLLYSDQRSTAGREQEGASSGGGKKGSGGSCARAPGQRARGWRKEDRRRKD